MTRRTTSGVGLLGVGLACLACCAPPIVGVLAAMVGALIGVARFGAFGLAVIAGASLTCLHRHRSHRGKSPVVPVTLEATIDA